MNEQTALGRITAVKGALCEARFKGGAPCQARVGDLVKMKTARSIVFGIVAGVTSTGGSDVGVIAIDLIGEMLHSQEGGSWSAFKRGVSISPTLGTEVEAGGDNDLKFVYARPDKPCVRIGALYQAPDVAANLLVDDLLNKHFAILGTTGSGKSCATSLILHAILKAYPCGHIILLDPHDEYRAAFGDRAEFINTSNLHLPYWLLSFDELKEVMVSKTGETRESESRILKDAILKVKKTHPENEPLSASITVDSPVPYRLSVLKKLIDDEMGVLNKPEGAAPYLRLLARLDSLTSDKRFQFMFSGLMVRDILPDILARLLRVPVDGKPITIIDLSGVPSEITNVVVSVMCRAVFDFALWNHEDHKVPVLLVCEESQRYIPSNENLGFEPTKRALTQIAQEGRKYGVSLCLISQRPSELSAGILSQCGTMIALRMNNEQDLAYVRSALPEGSESLLSVLPALRVQEAVISGEGVNVPMRVELDTLPPEHLPLSVSAKFSQSWQAETEGPETIAYAISRWRSQKRDR